MDGVTSKDSKMCISVKLTRNSPFWIFMFLFCFINLCSGQDATYHVDEEVPVNTPVGNVADSSNLISILGDTSAEYNSLRFSFLSRGNEYASYFKINETTSDITVADRLDRETICEYSVTCILQLDVVAQSTLGSFFRKLHVQIILDDINDHAPTFSQSSVTLTISEAVFSGTSFTFDGAEDKDKSQNYSLQSYELHSSLPEGELPFSIRFEKKLDFSSTIILFVDAPLNREERDSYDLTIIAKDGDTPPLTGTMVIHVIIEDINDNTPKFNSSIYNVTIQEDAPVDSIVLQLKAVDPDAGNNGEIRYRLSDYQSEEIKRTFNIDEISGNLTIKSKLTYRPGKIHEIIVEAYDLGDQPLLSQTYVYVRVTSAGNKPPEIHISWFQNTGVAQVPENATIRSVVAHVAVVDHDDGQQGDVVCVIQNADFVLQRMENNPKEYYVAVNKSLDREKKAQYNLTVHCMDNGNPPLRSSSWFIIQILDINDEKPQFLQAYSKSVPENNTIGQSLLTVEASDLDEGNNSKVYYKVIGDGEGLVVVGDDGIVRANTSFDRETMSSLEFTVLAIDHGEPPKTGSTTVSLYFTDVNDCAPNFTLPVYEFYVKENMQADTTVGHLSAKDKDLGKNGRVTYDLHPLFKGKPEAPVVVFSDGLIKTDREFNREEIPKYEFMVIAKDDGDVSLTSTVNVVVNVEDVNDQVPVIMFPNSKNDTIWVPHDTQPWAIISRVLAKDNDAPNTDNSRLTYMFGKRNDTNLFQVNPNTGEIQTRQILSHPTFMSKVYRIEILVKDNGKPSLNTTTPVRIVIFSQNKTDTTGSQESSQNFIIAIAVGVITVILSLAIVIIIFVLRKIDRQRQEQNKKGTETPEHQDKFDGSITVFSLPSEDSLLGEKKKKEVSFSLEEDVFSDDDLLQNHVDHKTFKPTFLSPKKADDTHSETSGDTGDTGDSGRGNSDEEMQTSFTHSPRDKPGRTRINSENGVKQEIIPFSFKKGLKFQDSRDIESQFNNKIVLLPTDSGIDCNSNDSDPHMEISRDFVV